MTRDLPPPTRARSVVTLLWAASRRRAAGRARRQQEIMGRRRKNSDSVASLSRVIAVLVVCLVHAALGWFALRFARNASTVEVERGGRIAVSADNWSLLENLAARQNEVATRKRELAALTRPRFEDRQALIHAEQERERAWTRFVAGTRPSGRRPSGAVDEHHAKLERQFSEQGVSGFARVDDSLAGQLAQSRSAPMVIIPVLGLVLLCWMSMLVCQGEGLELDVQRRRHPMWEWLLSHPIRPAHAFYAELLSPLMANPVYISAPIFLWVIFGHLFGVGLGLLAALVVGLPVALATSSLNKALEVAALLRLGVRSRGALLGVLSWVGYVAMLLPFLTLQSDGIAIPLGRFGLWLSPFFPAWPVRALTFGWGAAPSLAEVAATWLGLAATLAALAVWATHRAIGGGLQAPSGGVGPAGSTVVGTRSWLGRDPLQRKELLWLLRDKGAVVQIVLIPLTIAATQAFNFRSLYRLTSMSWGSLCGIAIICGTYFLLVLGPRSLASEGAALWLSLTWPRGLEDLLKAKARLWSRVANFVVGGVLVVAGVLFPAAWWKIALVYCGWLLFSSTLALKSVSLVTAPSASGEPEPPNRARQWIAMIGTLAFGTGVVTGSWHIAIIGIVFSSLVAVAMWQGLRARLPYLFDPWSELPIPAPSLLHATVAIALVVESVGVLTGVALVIGGPSSLWVARTLGYGLAGAVGCMVTQGFLNARGVRLGDIVRWPGLAPRFKLSSGLALGVGAGLVLALLATGYTALLRFIPAARESLDEATKMDATYKGQWIWIFLLATVIAPLAEEYLFRGLLFRTLERELGDWRALVLSAAFFAIFHPPLAWIPVGCVGLVVAWLFRNTRHLLPSVACHMTYNATLVTIAHLTS